MSRIKIIMIVVACVAVIALGVVVGMIVSKKQAPKMPNVTYVNPKKGTSDLTEGQKEIAGLDTKEKTSKEKAKESEEKTYSTNYKEYLKLSDEEKEKMEIVPREQEVKIDALDEIKQYLDTNTIPEKFNLSERIKIKVDDQGGYGLCWGFASLNSLETYLALNERKDYDFSEMHLNYIESDLIYGYRGIDTGGNFSIFKDYLNVSGVVLEDTVPYKNYSEKEYAKFTDMEPVKIVTETVDFPTIYKSEYSMYTDEEIQDFRNTVKRHIMKNGGLYAEVVATSEKNAYIDIDTYDIVNHAVTIVGWDDNYSKNNFRSPSGKTPEHDGAYIALNSWGESRNDKGYYYISYDDKYVESGLSGVVSTSLDNAYKLSSISNDIIRDYLEKDYGNLLKTINGEKYATKNLISTIRYLDFSNKNVSSLSGFEIFYNLYYLNLSNNNISNLANLVNLPNIKSIDLSKNKIKDASVFSKMDTGLYFIDLSDNEISDISSLENLNYEQDSEYNNYYEIHLNRNKGISGYSKLKNANALYLDGCEIKQLEDMSKKENLYALDLSNNPEMVIGNSFPSSGVADVLLVNSNIGDNEIQNIKGNIYSLNVSKNKITSLENFHNISNLYSLSISENPVEGWEYLEEIIQNRTSQNYYYDDEYGENYFSLEARNCNISNLDLFNDIKLDYLDVSNNNITDLSGFKNEMIYTINLSGNVGLKNFEAISKIPYVILEDCKINNLDEIMKLDNVFNLSLANNELEDITKLSDLKNLFSLSLAGNKNLVGKLNMENLKILNLEDCDLDNSSLFESLDCSNLNIKGNPSITSIYNIVKTKNQYIYINIDSVNYDDISKLSNAQKEILTIDYNAKLVFNETLSGKKINDYALKKFFNKNWNKVESIENGKIDKGDWSVVVEDTTKDTVEIKIKAYEKDYCNLTNLVLKYKSTKVNDDTNENTVTNTNTIENTINNTINNEVSNIVNENVVTNEIVENQTVNEVTKNEEKTVSNEIVNEVEVEEVTNEITNLVTAE